MEQVSGETIFWLIALGIVVGWITHLVIGEKGFGLGPNLASGAVGSLIVGLIALQLGMPGSLLFGFLGCMTILFLANVFSVGSAHETGMKITNKR
ncbi:hypothetical protein ACG2F4_06970 [Halalkalibaculum sp. DA3122]|uniref:hypothetical protein n=1 Tax=unclassified Halalkalibaculum TaxID=2964617 RepID=UPI003753EBFE